MTRFVTNKGKPILNVFHHEEDGAWEFTGGTQAVEDADWNWLLLIPEFMK